MRGPFFYRSQFTPNCFIESINFKIPSDFLVKIDNDCKTVIDRQKSNSQHDLEEEQGGLLCLMSRHYKPKLIQTGVFVQDQID